jgi:hypothetical protein
MTEQRNVILQPYIDLFLQHGIRTEDVDERTIRTVPDQHALLTFKVLSELLDMVEPGDHVEGFVTVTEYPTPHARLAAIEPILNVGALSAISMEVGITGKITIVLWLPDGTWRFKIRTQTYTTDRDIKQGDIVTLSSGYYSPKHMNIYIAARDFKMSELVSLFNDEYISLVDDWVDTAIEEGYLVAPNNHHNIVSETDDDFLGFYQKGHREFYASGVSQSTAILVPVIED